MGCNLQERHIGKSVFKILFLVLENRQFSKPYKYNAIKCPCCLFMSIALLDRVCYIQKRRVIVCVVGVRRNFKAVSNSTCDSLFYVWPNLGYYRPLFQSAEGVDFKPRGNEKH